MFAAIEMYPVTLYYSHRFRDVASDIRESMREVQGDGGRYWNFDQAVLDRLDNMAVAFLDYERWAIWCRKLYFPSYLPLPTKVALKVEDLAIPF